MKVNLSKTKTSCKPFFAVLGGTAKRKRVIAGFTTRDEARRFAFNRVDRLNVEAWVARVIHKNCERIR